MHRESKSQQYGLNIALLVKASNKLRYECPHPIPGTLSLLLSRPPGVAKIRANPQALTLVLHATRTLTESFKHI